MQRNDRALRTTVWLTLAMAALYLWACAMVDTYYTVAPW